MKNNEETISQIKGLGTDIIEIDRVRKSIERHGLHFLNRLFTQKEQDYCYKYKDPVPHFAGRFAAKEAIVKALGTGFGAHVSWHDIEVLNDEHGKPIPILKPMLISMLRSSDSEFERKKQDKVLVSISHCETYATATALWYTWAIEG